MTENLKKFCEEVSKDRNLTERLKNADEAALLAVAKELNLELTEEDFQESGEAAMSEDELGAVAGGGWCGCGLAGLGRFDGIECKCPGAGLGFSESDTSYCVGHGNAFCVCALAGGGATDGMECKGNWK